jgi:hypothetical protein
MDDIELKYPALNYYYYAEMAASEDFLGAFRKYLKSSMEGFFGATTSADGINGLNIAVDFCFDRFICYQELQVTRQTDYAYDVDAWRAAVDPRSILEFALDTPRRYELVADERLQPRLREFLEGGHSLTEAVYKLRSGFIGFRGDVVFSYQRSEVTDTAKVA